jgi:hypothetical protein
MAIGLKPVPTSFDSEEYDSDDEKYFDWWLAEAKEAGYIDEYYKCESIVAVPLVEMLLERIVRGKSKWEFKTLFNKVTYTPDRVVIWNKSAIGVFAKEYFVNNGNTMVLYGSDKPYFYAGNYNGLLYSVIDVKPSLVTTHNSSGLTFPLKQKLIWSEWSLYVQKAILFPTGSKKATNRHLFFATYVPDRYRFTNVKKTYRKINFRFINIKTFITNVFTTAKV